MSRASDLRWMRRALALARQGGRAVAPNPRVGCVIVKGGRRIAEAFHRRDGGPHAEAAALKKAGARAEGATAFVTLEPCRAHAGKRTPPCADALAQAGIARVVAAMKDPNPAVSGKGLTLLRRAGVKAQAGLLRAEAEELNAPFLCRMRRHRPYVILKSALSLDGKAFARGGASRWVTGPAARRAAHRMRAQADAVLVGIGTALADDPALTSHGAGPDPVPVVLDSRLRLPRKSRLLRGSRKPLVFTSSAGSLAGAEVIRVPGKAGRLDLKAVLAALASRGLGTLLVEGGPTVHASFLEAGLADEVRAFIAPKLLAGTDDPNAAPRLIPTHLNRLGPDFLFYGKLRWRR